MIAMFCIDWIIGCDARRFENSVSIRPGARTADAQRARWQIYREWQMGEPSRSYKVGDLTVTKIEEQMIRGIPPAYLYPAMPADEFAAIAPKLGSEDLGESRADFNIAVHTWLVQTPKHTILVDTGSGNHKEHPQNPLFHRLDLPYLQRLADAGVRPEDVDYVFNTHLHVDHVGWNTILEKDKWIPTFPNARYVMPSAERDYYSSPASHNDVNLPSLGTYEDSVLPIIEAGLVDFVGPQGGNILDHFTFVPTPGHSIGHMSIQFASNGAHGIFAGDVMHSPMQVIRPDINSVFCEFLDQAVDSRRKILDHVAENNALYFGTHFAGHSAGTIIKNDGGYSWTSA
jgi:glyoxylase-like metal-dependent hydrolase (beta-lactamase superfamily II)